MSVNGNYDVLLRVRELPVDPLTFKNDEKVEKSHEDNNVVINIPDDVNNDENIDDDNSNNNNDDSEIDLGEHSISPNDKYDEDEEDNNDEYQNEETNQVNIEDAVRSPSITVLRRAISKLLFPPKHPTMDGISKQKSLTKIVVDNITKSYI
eukprot:CAMPEP_0196767566 /NCGR_PEP_ID=MMETSP1095-20130614/41747_1 /TAXON_ID=96789 ORGANISM="Chromulina nebulosa, Strain UTEXLB2642" /NCGR_SAMPLE_ID=MMETSP1095 /ASSEMBLY_ACC=CAM_ASM_000446 /LENGTH=150 /DNA_ID=CAMNT_0042136011 /DNA_START=107 /DNA_END=559 /DNA_ORIENTATION=-